MPEPDTRSTVAPATDASPTSGSLVHRTQQGTIVELAAKLFLERADHQGSPETGLRLPRSASHPRKRLLSTIHLQCDAESAEVREITPHRRFTAMVENPLLAIVWSNARYRSSVILVSIGS